MSTAELLDEKYYKSAPSGSLSERLVIGAREQIYRDFLRLAQATERDEILDVGVSDVITDSANYLERLHPHKHRIHCAGLGDPAVFYEAYPHLRFTQLTANAALPFQDKSFDIATSNAVLEHVGSRENQIFLLSELRRVAKRVFVSVPHRFFPVEHHSKIPLLHWNDHAFRIACALTGKSLWASPAELILMSKRRLRDVAPSDLPISIGYTGLKLGPVSSNLFIYFESEGD